MPRNAQGIYSLPPGNPVIPGTLIESTWANPTMSDIAAALTGSLPRNGSAPMQGPLILAGNASVPLEAVPLQQLNSIVGGSNTYLPAGAIQLFAMTAIPSGWLECNGSAISRTTYANLFAAIGTTYGAGNGTTTFNLPDLRGMFVRGWDNGRSLDPGRGFGSQQAAANNPHTHTPTVVNPAHNHALTDPGHNHALTDPGHAHSFPVGVVAGPEAGGTAETNVGTGNTNSAQTGISIAAAISGISSAAASQATSVSIASEGIEARPINVAMVYAIKAYGALQTDGLGSMAFQNKEAVDITGGSGVFTTLQCTTAPTQPNDVARLADIGGSLSAVLSADPQVLTVDNTTPATPILRPQTNVPFGMAKLDAAGYVPSSILNITDLTFLGSWDASTSNVPTGIFVTGDYYAIDVAGTLTLHTSGGNVAVNCNIGDQIIYNSATPGWWYVPAVVPTSLPASSITNVPHSFITAVNVQAAINQLADKDNETVGAADVSFVPGGTIAATNVQAAIQELDTEKLALAGGTLTGTLNLANSGFTLGSGGKGLSYAAPSTKYVIGDGTGYFFQFTRSGVNSGLPIMEITDNSSTGNTVKINGSAAVGPPTLGFFNSGVQDWRLSGTSDSAIRFTPYSNPTTPIAGAGVFLSIATGANWATLSDRRDKKDIEPLVGGLSSVLALKPSLFRFNGQKDAAAKQVGFIAQDVQDVVPQAVSTIVNAEGERLGLDMQKIIPYLVSAIQELTAEIAGMKNGG